MHRDHNAGSEVIHHSLRLRRVDRIVTAHRIRIASRCFNMSFCSLVRGHPISPMWAILSPSASRIWIRFGPRSAPCSGSCQVSIFVMENGFFVPLCFKVTASVYPWSLCSWLQSTMSAVRESGASPGTVFGPYGSKTMEKPSFQW